MYQPRLKTVEQALKALARQAQTGVLSTSEKAMLVRLNAEHERLKHIEKMEHDVAEFAYEFFSDERNSDNSAGNFIKHEDQAHESIENIAPIHRSMYDISDLITRNGAGKYAILAPRGHAKTSVLSTILALHEIVYYKREYVLILSETDTLSKRILQAIATQLKHNAKLREWFGEYLKPVSTQNEKDNEEAFITNYGQLVEASSSGKAIRGKTFKGTRPDLILADDLSSMNNEATEAQRDKLLDWWNTSVTPLGSKKCAYIIVGTQVTATGLIATLMQKRDYTKIKFSAIIKPPANPQLWDDYLHIYNSDASDEVIEDFYETNREAMEDGIELAWPTRWTYRALMHEKVSIGVKAYNSEYLNESFAEDERFFKVDSYGMGRRVFSDVHYADAIEYDGKYYFIRDMTITVAYDPALGRSKRADANAAVFLGKHRDTGRVFVLQTLSKVCPPSEFIEMLFDAFKDYPRIDKLRMEGIGAYQLLTEEIEFHIRKNNMHTTKLDVIRSHGKQSKQSRIESLEPALANKSLVLNESTGELLGELNYYPQLRNDDLLDALTMAYQGLSKERHARRTRKPAGM